MSDAVRRANSPRRHEVHEGHEETRFGWGPASLRIRVSLARAGCPCH
ncbi:MAG: hypothetical protein AVDCRST_MAG64-878 [uncultured Phycisphaerae bacterium]|uniref:Uncharacterized protein n=1 Tax=uncultured Phycisphaerae bacterium TaxID=904963 RepID=A0A6J4NED1_9BACT|nr:MAG: hypothetical protein AVDCRST_MAG64-878 [uncultured Phycisphaerae bacterium]